MELKPNSDKYREESSAKQDKPKIEKMTTTEVKTRKKSLGTKFAETFLAEDIRDVKSYVVHDIIIPTAKDLVFNALNGVLEGLLYGTGGARKNRDSNRSKASYTAYYKSGSDRNERKSATRSGDVYDYEEILFANMGEAAGVLDALTEYAEEYGQVSVGEFYDAVGKTGEFTDRKYGWFKDDLRNVKPRRVHGGYILTLPKAISLD